MLLLVLWNVSLGIFCFVVLFSKMVSIYLNCGYVLCFSPLIVRALRSGSTGAPKEFQQIHELLLLGVTFTSATAVLGGYFCLFIHDSRGTPDRIDISCLVPQCFGPENKYLFNFWIDWMKVCKTWPLPWVSELRATKFPLTLYPQEELPTWVYSVNLSIRTNKAPRLRLPKCAFFCQINLH